MSFQSILIPHQLFYVIAPLLTALGGGFIFLKLKVPVGALIGSMIAVMLLSIFWGKVVLPKDLAIVAKIFAGTLIGRRISRESFSAVGKAVVPIAFFSVLIISLCIGAGFIIYNASSLDKASALFGSAPAGVSDMTLISGEFGADMPKVAVLQMIRLFICIIGIPILVGGMVKRRRKTETTETPADLSVTPDRPLQQGGEVRFGKYRISGPKRIVITLLVGTAGGLLGHAIGIPAGALTGAIFFVAFFNLLFFRLYISAKVSVGTQMLIGAVIGSGMSMEDVIGLKEVILPAIMIAFFMLFFGLALGFLLHKIWNIDLPTALIATAPGGMTQMSLIAPEMEAEVSIVVVTHLVRLLAVLITYPIIMKWII